MTARSLLTSLLPLALAAAAAAGCAASPVRTAPFRARPDSVAPGDLRGPFTGRVVDASSGAPVAGALVYATWTYQSGPALPAVSGHVAHVASTDADGRYAIPAVADVGGAPAAGYLADFTLLVYKRGFVAYRSDRRFADLGPRLDFAQRQHEVQLDRWRDDFSHARHLRYVGGGPAVAALTAWEAEAAIAELSGTRTSQGARDGLPATGAGAYVVAAQLLSEADIKARTRYDGAFETGPLGDEPDTAGYSSQHFKALGRPESFDIAVRLWRGDAGAAQERYEDLRATLPGVEETDELGSRSLRAAEAEVRGVAVLDGPRGLVFLVTCGKGQCASIDDAVALARLVQGRLEQLVPLDGLGAAAGGAP